MLQVFLQVANLAVFVAQSSTDIQPRSSDEGDGRDDNLKGIGKWACRSEGFPDQLPLFRKRSQEVVEHRRQSILKARCRARPNNCRRFGDMATPRPNRLERLEVRPPGRDDNVQCALTVLGWDARCRVDAPASAGLTYAQDTARSCFLSLRWTHAASDRWTETSWPSP